MLAQTVARADGQNTPYTLFPASGAQSCPPVVLLSPGFGGSQHGLSLLATALQQAGFNAYVIGHTESGPKQLRAALLAPDRLAAIIAGAGDPAAFTARFMDLDAVWTLATTPCRPPFTLFAGHSMGAQTVMMEAGAIARIGAMGQNRFDAYVALSPQGVGLRFAARAWQRVTKPVLMITGTLDKGVDGDFATRLTAFDGLPPGNKRLAIINQATHMTLGGRGGGALADLVPQIVRTWLKDLAITPMPRPLALDGVSFQQK